MENLGRWVWFFLLFSIRRWPKRLPMPTSNLSMYVLAKSFSPPRASSLGQRCN